MPQSPLLNILLFLLFILLFGTIGFYLVESKYSLFDSFYMSVITLSTVGYSEVGMLSFQGRIFTVIFILTGFLGITLAFRFLGEQVAQNWSVQKFKLKKNKTMIQKLKDHTIVCGYGRNGRQAVSRLKRHKQPYVVIENEERCITEFDSDILFLKGNALSDTTLLNANINEAKNLICALPSDADNLFVVLSARQLKPDIVIVSRVSEEQNQRKLELAGANHVIMPDKIGGDYMAALLTVPEVIQFLGSLDWWVDETSPNVEEVDLRKVPKEFQNKSLATMELRKRTGCNVIGYCDPHGNQIINPDANHILSVDGKLIVLGSRSSIVKLNRMFHLD